MSRGVKLESRENRYSVFFLVVNTSIPLLFCYKQLHFVFIPLLDLVSFHVSHIRNRNIKSSRTCVDVSTNISKCWCEQKDERTLAILFPVRLSMNSDNTREAKRKDHSLSFYTAPAFLWISKFSSLAHIAAENLLSQIHFFSFFFLNSSFSGVTITSVPFNVRWIIDKWSTIQRHTFFWRTFFSAFVIPFTLCNLLFLSPFTSQVLRISF